MDYSKFTNLYSLNKTLRFELKPTPNTIKNLEKFDIVRKDEKRAKAYDDEMKNIFDKAHNKFINESLSNVRFRDEQIRDLQQFRYELKSLKKDKKGDQRNIKQVEKSIDLLQKELRKQITQSYIFTAKNWKSRYISLEKAKKINQEILTEKISLDLLEELYPDKRDFIQEFKGFYGYFGGYNENRKNYYVDEDKATSIANRIINENLIKFLDNISLYQEAKKYISELSQYSDYFELSEYHNYITQNGIDTYNAVLGGYVENKIKIQGINEYINLYKQKNPHVKISKLTFLHKQIGSPRKESDILIINKGKEWNQLYNLIHNQRKLISKLEEEIDINDIFDEKYNLDQIYLNKVSINTISSKWFTNWQTLEQKLVESKVFQKSKGEVKIPEVISLLQVQEGLNSLLDQNPENYYKETYKDQYQNKNLWDSFLSIFRYELITILLNIAEKEKLFITKKEQSIKDKDSKQYIKDICDAYLSLERILKYFIINSKYVYKFEQDPLFYTSINNFIHTDTNKIVSYYNAFRNYLTRKPYNEDKIKLNFDTAELLTGWDISKEISKLSIILREKDKYKLVILNKNIKGANKVFEYNEKNILYQVTDDTLEKMLYKLMKDVTLSIPKVSTQLKEVVSHFNKLDTDYILKGNKWIKPVSINKDEFELNNRIYLRDNISQSVIRDKSSDNDEKMYVKAFQKDYLRLGGDLNFYKLSLIKWIDFCKKILTNYKNNQLLNFTKLKQSAKYKSIDEFYNDVNKCAYVVKFIPINRQVLDQYEQEGKLFIFDITNKDWNVYKKGKNNIHTLYWNALFSQENLEKTVLKLNGEAEIFIRKASTSIEVKQKQDLKENLLYKGKTQEKIIINQRYTQDKYLFHIPITINFDSEGVDNQKKFNTYLNQELTQSKPTILGIDRGEKHLLYYSLIDLDGNIIKQGSLNTINNTDYYSKLTTLAGKRDDARKNWDEIGNIKNFKEGYLSQAVHQIYQLMIDYNAIVVLEDLNSEFKAKRSAKVEKSVYKKFELSLARKLNHLILKDKENTESGGTLNAYQLTPYLSPGDMSYFEGAKQWGSIFYVRANYTSTTDPIAGWRKHLYISNGANIDKIQEFFQDIEIEYNPKHKAYQFSYIYSGKSWTLIAHQDIIRFRWSNSQRKMEKYHIHTKFEDLFRDFDNTRSITEQLRDLDKSEFRWKDLVFYFNLLTQIRNTDRDVEGNDNDFIQSPIYSDYIQGFYDSRKTQEYKEKYGIIVPDNGDSNGAYNIAKKGIIAFNRVKQNSEKPELYISDIEWDEFNFKNVKY